eukprot:scaffold66255_cov78-Phaeocystis_antarctica.AAC.1
MMFSVLSVVLASAGPGVPGVGDVFPMGPTMAYGAVPHMLLSAPDWGSGFDLGCWSSTGNFASPQNASIAGQTCTPGAQIWAELFSKLSVGSLDTRFTGSRLSPWEVHVRASGSID